MKMACASSGWQLAILAPPYDKFVPIDECWRPKSAPPQGIILIWQLIDAEDQTEQFRFVLDRPPGVPAVVVLPVPQKLHGVLPLLKQLWKLSPRAILPSGPIVTPPRIRDILAAPPISLAKAVENHLAKRDLLPDGKVRQEIRALLEIAPEVSSISKLARRLYTSRRTLGRHFAAAGVPVPSHWLQMARLLYVTLQLQNDSSAIFRIALRAGYPDGFTMSNQMKRLLDCRPTQIRQHLGWEWVLESWIRQETFHGFFEPNWRPSEISPYHAKAVPVTRAHVAELQPPFYPAVPRSSDDEDKFN